MSFSWQEYLNETGGIDFVSVRDIEEYRATSRNVAEENQRILILDSVGQFDRELCLAVQKRIQERLKELDEHDDKKLLN